MSPQEKIEKILALLAADKGVGGLVHAFEQLSWMILFKLLDDRAAVQNAALEYRVADILSHKPDELRAFVNHQLWPFLTKLGDKQPLFHPFTQCENRIIAGETLIQCFEIIESLDTEANEGLKALAQAYRGLLQQTIQDNRFMGDFYTPNPIVDSVVKVLNPKAGQTVYDPCAGTGGFLLAALDHMQQNQPDLSIEAIAKGLVGNEKHPLPYLLGITNLLLHGIETPNLQQVDTLLNQAKVAQTHSSWDIVATTPPFAARIRIPKRSQFEIDSQHGELLFLQHIMNGLNDKGKAAIVLAERFLFSDLAPFKQVKELLLKRFNLHTILSLPPGAFAPHAGVKTSVLFFDNNGPTEHIWYFECEPKKSLSPRKPLNHNDLAGFVEAFSKRETTANSWMVDANRLNNFDLTARNPAKLKQNQAPPATEILAQIRQNDKQVSELLDKVEQLLK